MKIKSTHFIPNAPGLPIYEMEDGTLRIPFTPKGKPTMWLDEKEIVAGSLGKVPPDRLKQLVEPFAAARKMIGIRLKVINDDVPPVKEETKTE